MAILAWIVLGLIVGFVVGKLVNKTGEGLPIDLMLGVVGAIFGGELLNKLGMVDVTGLTPKSATIAAGCAALVLIVYHVLRGTASTRSA